MTDCIIIGAGLLGMMTARELAVSGMDVTVLDSNRAGQESSWAGGGIISPLFPWRYPEAVSRLASWSQERYKALADSLLDETGVDPEYEQSGLLIPGLIDELDDARQWAKKYKVKLLEGRAVEQILEHNSAKFCSDLYDDRFPNVLLPDVAQLRNPRLVKAMRASLEPLGIKILENTKVSEILIKPTRVAGVVANGDVMKAKRVVVAGGAWSGDILKALGHRLDVYPVRGQMLIFKAEPGLLKNIILASDHYLIPRRDGRILAGSTLEHVNFDKTPTKEANLLLRQRAIELVPALENVPVELQWTGLRPGNAQSGVPYISKVDGCTGLYVNSGHYRNGVVLGLASARLMTDLILHRKPILDPEPYKI